MSGVEDQPNYPETVEAVPLLRDVLVNTTFTQGRVLSDPIRSIVLGVFDQEAMDLIELTINHPNNHEFGKLVLVTNTGKVRIPNNSTEGNENEVIEASFRAKIFSLDLSLPKQARQELFNGFGMHTHPDESGPSYEDISNLFVGDFDPSATTGMFVINFKKKIVVFRGRNTPQLTREQVAQKVNYWKSVHLSRVLPLVKPGMTADQRMAIITSVAGQIDKEITSKYDLKYFECALNESVVRLKV